MQLDYAFFADSAANPNGKLYILGGGFCQVTLPSIPGRVGFVVITGFRFTAADSGKAFDVEVRFVDSAGKLVVPPATLSFRSAEIAADSDLEITVPTITAMAPTFGEPGRYTAQVWLGDRQLGEVPLRVDEAAPGALGPQPN